MNMKSTSSALCSGCSPHKEACDILSENLYSQRFQAYSPINGGDVLININKVKSRHVIGLPTTCGYNYCGEETGFNV